jgi:hypothetical protein
MKETMVGERGEGMREATRIGAMRAFDTTPEAERVHLDVLRRMGGERRAALAVSLSKQVGETALAGI